MSTTLLNVGTILLLLISFMVNKKKTKQSLKKAYKSLMGILPTLITLLVLMGIGLAVVNEEFIRSVIGDSSGLLGVLISFVIGSLTFIPGFVAMPLGANLVKHGAGLVQIATFLASLMAVGIISLPVEIKYFGKKATLLRNLLGVIATVVFATLVWMVL